MRTALDQLEEIKQANIEDRIPRKEFKLEYNGNPKPELGVMGYASDKAREIHQTLTPFMSKEWDVWTRDVLNSGDYVNTGETHYQGLWKNKYKNGYGRQVDSQGNIFEGWFKTNNRHGEG